MDNERGRVFVKDGRIAAENITFDGVGLRFETNGNITLVMHSDSAITIAPIEDDEIGCKPCRTLETEVDKIDQDCKLCRSRFIKTLPPFDTPNDDYLKIIMQKGKEMNIVKVKTEKAYYVGTHRYSFRSGEPAEIVGVVIAEDESGEKRACYHVRYDDGRQDYSPLCDGDNYVVVPGSQLKLKPGDDHYVSFDNGK